MGARRVLLDALEALRPHRGALILAGAQAVYLHAGPSSLPIADFTTDGDLTVDPRSLSPVPPLFDLMVTAGFELAELQGASEPGIWQKKVEIEGREIVVPVDLIVPDEAAPPGGRRGARLQGHDKRAARKIAGLEAALLDNEIMPIEALDPDDPRSARLRVAGVAALLIAKTHKIVDRVESGLGERTSDKDGADVIRLMGAKPPTAVARTLAELMDDPIAGSATRLTIERFDSLFGRRSGQGIVMASRALREAMPEDRVRAISLGYARELYAVLGDSMAKA